MCVHGSSLYRLLVWKEVLGVCVCVCVCVPASCNCSVVAMQGTRMIEFLYVCF